MAIQVLPPHVVHHIAAGEVIDRPVSVIKELIENSIDAGATRIEIWIEKAGLQVIKVVDNGSGIPSTDTELIFTRYSTSKLSTVDDLYQLHSFGFRGEALFSIASVGNVKLTTRTAAEESGNEVTILRGQLQPIIPTGARVGTTIEVTNLFQHFPVRQQSVDPKKELKVIQRLIQHFALAHPHVAFTLHHDGKILLSSYEQETIADRLAKIWQLAPHQQLCFESSHLHGKMVGYMSLPEFFSSHRSQQVIVVNGRVVSFPELHAALEEGLKNFKHPGKHPRYFITLELNPHSIDVNVHPQKKQVQVLHLDELVESLSQSVQEYLHRHSAKNVRYTANSLFPQSQPLVRETIDFEIIGNILQFDHTYLLATTTQGLLLVDQHAADERLWYNKLLKNDKLLKKLSLHLSKACQDELADDIYQHSFEDQINATVATIACHQAIRAGQLLSQSEAKELVEQVVKGGAETMVCPHGRPTHMFITKSQLDRSFRRT